MEILTENEQILLIGFWLPLSMYWLGLCIGTIKKVVAGND